MPAFQIVTFYKSGAYGWTETWYDTVADHAAALTRMEPVIAARRRTMNTAAFITHVRVSDVAIRNDSKITAFSAADGRGQFANNLEGEQPYDGLLIRVEAGPGNRRMWILRGLPGGQITSEGLYNPTPDFRTRITTLTTTLTEGAGPPAIIDPMELRITGGAVSVPVTAATVVAGNPRAITVTVTADGWPALPNTRIRLSGFVSMRPVNGTWRVRSVVGNAMTLYPKKATVVGTYGLEGFAAQVAVIYSPISALIPERGVRRDTGRPSDSPRGRRSRVNQ